MPFLVSRMHEKLNHAVTNIFFFPAPNIPIFFILPPQNGSCLGPSSSCVRRSRGFIHTFVREKHFLWIIIDFFVRARTKKRVIACLLPPSVVDGVRGLRRACMDRVLHARPDSSVV